MSDLPLAARKIIEKLGLESIREGVYVQRAYVRPAVCGERPAASHAYALAAHHAPSLLHRLDCDELWHFYAGRPLNVYLLADGAFTCHKLGGDVAAGEMPFLAIPRGTVFGAFVQENSDWCLFGCTCIPAFEFAGCEYIMADHPALRGYTGDRELLERLTAYK